MASYAGRSDLVRIARPTQSFQRLEQKIKSGSLVPVPYSQRCNFDCYLHPHTLQDTTDLVFHIGGQVLQDVPRTERNDLAAKITQKGKLDYGIDFNPKPLLLRDIESTDGEKSPKCLASRLEDDPSNASCSSVSGSANAEASASQTTQSVVLDPGTPQSVSVEVEVTSMFGNSPSRSITLIENGSNRECFIGETGSRDRVPDIQLALPTDTVIIEEDEENNSRFVSSTAANENAIDDSSSSDSVTLIGDNSPLVVMATKVPDPSKIYERILREQAQGEDSASPDDARRGKSQNNSSATGMSAMVHPNTGGYVSSGRNSQPSAKSPRGRGHKRTGRLNTMIRVVGGNVVEFHKENEHRTMEMKAKMAEEAMMAEEAKMAQQIEQAKQANIPSGLHRAASTPYHSVSDKEAKATFIERRNYVTDRLGVHYEQEKNPAHDTSAEHIVNERAKALQKLNGMFLDEISAATESSPSAKTRTADEAALLSPPSPGFRGYDHPLGPSPNIDIHKPFENFSGFTPLAHEMQPLSSTAPKIPDKSPLRIAAPAYDLARRNTVAAPHGGSHCNSPSFECRDFSVDYKTYKSRNLDDESESASSRYSFDCDKRDSTYINQASAMSVTRVPIVRLPGSVGGGSSKTTLVGPSAAAPDEFPAQANIPGFDNKRSYSTAVRTMKKLSESDIKSPTTGLRRAATTARVQDAAARRIIARNLAAVEAKAYDDRAPQREHAHELEERLTRVRDDEEANVEAAEIASKKMVTTPYPHELKRIEEEARKERLRKKTPRFWW